jgi:hypothetical protein
MQEVLALVAAKRNLYLEELGSLDGRELMRKYSAVWKRISATIMKVGHSPCPRDLQSCKTKWHQIFPDYKRIADHHAKTSINALEFWDMAFHEHNAHGLPKSYPVELYKSLYEWNEDQPGITPPHVRDMLAPTDNNYRRGRIADEGVSNEEDVHESRPMCKEPPLPMYKMPEEILHS